jgi:hypothetical protein
LIAFCSKPIIIFNKSLGYHLNYYLDLFKFSDTKAGKYFSIKGNCLFTDDLLSYPDSLKKIIEEKRKQAYIGSRMHFLRCLSGEETVYSNYLFKSSGFRKLNSIDIITTKTNLIISNDEIIRQTNKYLKANGKVFVDHHDVKLKGSYLNNHEILLDKEGYYDQNEIIWEGDLAKLRIADQLPFDYTLKED